MPYLRVRLYPVGMVCHPHFNELSTSQATRSCFTLLQIEEWEAVRYNKPVTREQEFFVLSNDCYNVCLHFLCPGGRPPPLEKNPGTLTSTKLRRSFFTSAPGTPRPLLQVFLSKQPC